MPIYNVSYDLSEPGQNYGDLSEELKRSEDWCHVLQSTWMVKTPETADELYTRLKRHLDQNDKLLLIETTNHWIARLSRHKGDCIKQLFQ